MGARWTRKRPVRLRPRGLSSQGALPGLGRYGPIRYRARLSDPSMIPLLPTLLTLFQEAAPAPASTSFLNNPLMPFIPIGVLFFLLLVMPERKKQKRRQAMLDALKKGDRVMTTSGIYGTIVTTTSEIAVLQVADNVRMRFSRGAVQSVMEPEKDAALEEKAEPSKA